MKELLTDLGYLVAWKKLNRDELAERIGTTRSNLISAFKGRRPLPVAQLPLLRQALGLDDDYRFVADRVHALTVLVKDTPEEIAYNLLRRFMLWPLRSKWLLRGIGEGSRAGFAYVLEDSRGTLVAVRNDDALLGAVSDPRNKPDEGTAVFSPADGSPEREIALATFSGLFLGNMSADDLRLALICEAKVWTWSRLKEKAEALGQNAESAARALGLADGTD